MIGPINITTDDFKKLEQIVKTLEATDTQDAKIQPQADEDPNFDEIAKRVFATIMKDDREKDLLSDKPLR